MALDVGIDTDSVEYDHELSDNVIEDFVEFSRSRQIGNEEQAVVTFLGAMTGFLKDWRDNCAVIVTGGTSSGKSHMMREVVVPAFSFMDDGVVYELSGGSDKAAIDDEALDGAAWAYFHELQKIPDEILEFIKSVSEDGGFTYGRNVPDADSDSHRNTVHIERDPVTVVFTFADENQATVDDELRTRSIEVKVDESPEKNAAVHDMKWGHERLRMEGSDHEYRYTDKDLWTAVRRHIEQIPKDMDVIYPTGDGRFEGDTWNAAHVSKPLFNFERNASTRASAMMGSLVKASALVNYHNRDTVTIDDEEYLVAEPVDLANVIACRRTLLALTHGLTEKKFHIIDAILDRGGKADVSGTAVQAEKSDIVEYIQENDHIATMSKSTINDLLEDMDEELLVNKRDHPDDARKNIYVYDGGRTFRPPNIMDEWDHFQGIEDPIREQPIEVTVEQQLDALEANMSGGTLAASDAMGGSEDAESTLSGFDGSDSGSPSDLTKTERAVAQRLAEHLDGYWLDADVLADNSLRVEHMVGVTPTEPDPRDDETYLSPSREPRGDDKVDSFMSPDNDIWEGDSFEQVEDELDDAIASLREQGVFEIDVKPSGDAEVKVNL